MTKLAFHGSWNAGVEPFGVVKLCVPRGTCLLGASERLYPAVHWESGQHEVRPVVGFIPIVRPKPLASAAGRSARVEPLRRLRPQPGRRLRRTPVRPTPETASLNLGALLALGGTPADVIVIDAMSGRACSYLVRYRARFDGAERYRADTTVARGHRPGRAPPRSVCESAMPNRRRGGIVAVSPACCRPRTPTLDATAMGQRSPGQG